MPWVDMRKTREEVTGYFSFGDWDRNLVMSSVSAPLILRSLLGMRGGLQAEL